MRTTTLTVSFNTEKLDALKFHMEKRDADLQAELNDTVQKLYEKYVSQATREYIDDKVAREVLSARDRTRRAERSARRVENLAGDGRRGIRAEKEDAVWCRWKKHIAFCKPLCAPVSGFRQPGGIVYPGGE